MAIVEFPNVKVDIKQKGYDNPLYLDIVLSQEKSLLEKAMAFALVCGVENSKKFVGATFDEYILGAENHAPKIALIKNLEWEGLDVLIQQFAAPGWVYGVGGKGNRLEAQNYILKTKQEIIQYIRESHANYNQYTIQISRKALNSLFFIPSPKFTQGIWGFTYTIDDLGKMVDFKLSQE